MFIICSLFCNSDPHILILSRTRCIRTTRLSFQSIRTFVGMPFPWPNFHCWSSYQRANPFCKSDIRSNPFNFRDGILYVCVHVKLWRKQQAYGYDWNASLLKYMSFSSRCYVMKSQFFYPNIELRHACKRTWIVILWMSAFKMNWFFCVFN